MYILLTDAMATTTPISIRTTEEITTSPVNAVTSGVIVPTSRTKPSRRPSPAAQTATSGLPGKIPHKSITSNASTGGTPGYVSPSHMRKPTKIGGTAGHGKLHGSVKFNKSSSGGQNGLSGQNGLGGLNGPGKKNDQAGKMY